MKYENLYCLFALVFFNGCFDGQTEVKPQPATMTRIIYYEDSVLGVNGYTTLANFENSGNDTTLKYSGYYFDTLASNADSVEEFYLSCLDVGNARLNIQRLGSQLYTKYSLNIDSSFRFSDSSYHIYPALDVGIDSQFIISCSHGTGDSGKMSISAKNAITQMQDTIVRSIIYRNSIATLTDTIFDATSSGNACQYLNGKDLLAPYRQAQISGSVVCNEPNQPIDSALNITFDYSRSPTAMWIPSSILSSPTKGLHGILFDHYDVIIKSSIHTGAVIYSPDDTSKISALKSKISSDSTKADSLYGVYDTSKENDNAFIGYDTTQSKSCPLIVPVYTKETECDAPDECSEEDVFSGYTCGEDSVSTPVITKKYGEKPAATNSSALYTDYTNEMDTVQADRQALITLQTTISSNNEYYVSVNLSNYEIDSEASDSLMSFYGYCEKYGIGALEFHDYSQSRVFVINGVDYQNTNSTSNLYWHVGRSLPIGMAMNDTGYLYFHFNSTDFVMRSFAGISRTGSFVSNLIPVNLNQNYPIERLVSHEGYHALVSSAIQAQPQDMDSTQILMLMNGDISRTGNGAVLMNNVQWKDLRLGVYNSQPRF